MVSSNRNSINSFSDLSVSFSLLFLLGLNEFICSSNFDMRAFNSLFSFMRSCWAGSDEVGHGALASFLLSDVEAVVFYSVEYFSSSSLFRRKRLFITFSATIRRSFRSSLFNSSISPCSPRSGSLIKVPWTYDLLNPLVVVFINLPLALKPSVCDLAPVKKLFSYGFLFCQKPSWVLAAVTFSSKSFYSFAYVFFTSYKSKIALSMSSIGSFPGILWIWGESSGF